MCSSRRSVSWVTRCAPPPPRAGMVSGLLADEPDVVLVCDEHDNAVRWRAGERLHHLFEARCDQFTREGRDGHLAVDSNGTTLTYRALDERANQLARHLRTRGIGPGRRVALCFD